MTEEHNEHHILLAYGFMGDGVAVPLKGKKISLEIKGERLAWVHLDANNPKTRSWLKKEVSYLDHIIIDALLADETRPRMVKFENGSLIILRSVNLNANSKPEDMVSIRLWIDSERIISLQKRNLTALNNIQKIIEEGKAPNSAGEFFTMLCGELSDRLKPVLEQLDEITGEIEEKVLEKHDINLREDIIMVRKQTAMFKRYLAPQKEVINILRNCDQDWLNDMDRRNLQENFDHITRYLEDLEEVRERSQIIHDELTNSLTEKLNKNMYVMSVFAAIFMPLTFVTGIFGMNIINIPLSKNPFGFLILIAFFTLLAGLQIGYFKKKKWF